MNRITKDVADLESYLETITPLGNTELDSDACWTLPPDYDDTYFYMHSVRDTHPTEHAARFLAHCQDAREHPKTNPLQFPLGDFTLPENEAQVPTPRRRRKSKK